jgi:hypothetical protein
MTRRYMSYTTEGGLFSGVLQVLKIMGLDLIWEEFSGIRMNEAVKAFHTKVM